MTTSALLPRRRLATAAALACAGLGPWACAAAAAAPRQRKPADTAPDAAPDALAYGRREDVLRFAADLVERESELNQGWVETQLARARFQSAVTRFIMPPAPGVAKNWQAYRSRFVEPVRLRAGLAFWREHEATLAKAEALWGVPAQIVVGILGVETIYGRDVGRFRVLDALATLSFDFPAGRRDRSAFFRDELGQFLLLCRRQRIEPTAPLGSYAGAMGWPQFMPSSWLKYAVDFNRDGRIDLNDPADAIGSVAHYMARFGWQGDLPTHFDVTPPADPQALATLLAPDILPSFSAAQFGEHGAALAEAGRAHAGPLALVELHNGSDPPSYVAGTANFYAITRYNWSSYYAMAVIELGRSVAALRLARR